jgi:energy-coupling factor transporter ATP-binding protein EcfA2
MKRLVGKPVLEVLDEQRNERLAASQQLRTEVYIPCEGVKADENGKFVVSDTNKAFDLLDEVKTVFLESDAKSVLLLSGPAGSGKSTFERELRGYLETVYAQKSEKEGRGKVVVLSVSLPTLRNPLGDLFHESLAAKGLRDAQINELRDLAKDGSVRLVFLLDGYDEMKSENLFKNLYTANNLEQYAKAGSGGPKVIISTRTELLSQNVDYARSFTPAVAGEGGGGESAESSLLELRLGAFDGKLRTYVFAHVVLQLRREWEKRVGPLLPLTPELATELVDAAAKAWGEEGEEEKEWWAALRDTLSVGGGEGKLAEGTLEDVVEAAKSVRDTASAATAQTHEGAVLRAATVLMGALETMPSQPEEVARGFAQQFGDDLALWLPGKYLAAFVAIPELKELTVTPFMVRIVVAILGQLEKERSTEASVKQLMYLLLDEHAVHAVWDSVRRFREEAGEAVDVASPAFKALLDGCEKLLRTRELLRAQEGLLRVADMHLRALTDQGLSEQERAELLAADAPLTGEREAAVAEAVRAAMAHALQRALERPAVRTRHIYSTFVTAWVEREARKRTNHGTFDPEKVRREATEWSRQLALTMVMENVTKVSTQATSELFHKASVWDPFLHVGGELRLAATRAAPVHFTDVLSFVHKTVQEYLCAEMLRTDLEEALQQPAASVGDMLAELALSEEAVEAGRPVQKALLRVGERLLESPWTRLTLAREDAVRDFLADAFLDDEGGFGEALLLLVMWAKRAAGGSHAAAAAAVQRNVVAVLTGTLPKRGGGTLLHAAAAEGSVPVLNRLVALLEASGGVGAVKEAGQWRDVEGRTALFVAAERGHVLALALLMAVEGAPLDVRRSLQSRVRTLAWQTGEGIGESALEVDLGNRATATAEGDSDGWWPLSWWVVGLPAAAPSSGRWRYEVELNLQRIHGEDMAASTPYKLSRLEQDAIVWCYFAPGGGNEVGGNDSWDTTGDEARRSLYEFPPTHMAACLTTVSVGWSVLGATLPLFDRCSNGYAWKFPALGVRGAEEGWPACGLWCDGQWHTTAEDQPEQIDAVAGPLLLQGGVVVVGMLLDADTGEMYVCVGVGAPWVMVQGAGNGFGGPLFPAVSCMGHTGSVRFNFGERTWKCESPTPGEAWTGISAAAEGDTPLKAAVAAGHDDAALLLLRRTSVEELKAADDHGQTLAHLAVKTGCVGVLRALGKEGVNLDVKDVDGDCPMLLAFRKEDKASMEALAEGGADVNVRDKVSTSLQPSARPLTMSATCVQARHGRRRPSGGTRLTRHLLTRCVSGLAGWGHSASRGDQERKHGDRGGTAEGGRGGCEHPVQGAWRGVHVPPPSSHLSSHRVNRGCGCAATGRVTMAAALGCHAAALTAR